jgi:LacI family transcriptional regulator
MIELQHRLVEAGHQAFYADRGLMDLGMDLGKVRRFVSRTEADAWLVQAAPREILEWFAGQNFPAFAFVGSFVGLPIAGSGPKKADCYREAVDALVQLGHRRITMIGRPQRRLPQLQYPETVFLEALSSHRIVTGIYNFPLWEKNSKEGLHSCLRSLFDATPPTALFVQEAKVFAAVQQFLATRGLKVPGDVSLICTDDDPNFEWQIPTVARFVVDSAPWVRRAVSWANNIAMGKDDRRQYLPKVRFATGGTIGPAPATR